MDVNDAAVPKGFRSENDLKEIKVKLPIRQHIKLHSLKLLKRESISDTVLKALTEYFDRMESAYGADGAAPGSEAESVEAALAGALDALADEPTDADGSNADGWHPDASDASE